MTAFKIVSYNVWFENILINERLESLIKIIKDQEPDVICLQEVREDLFERIRVEFGEFGFCIPKKMDKTYGCVILTKHKIQKFNEFLYPDTQMGRSLLVAMLKVGDKDIVIANTHFESVFNENNQRKLKQFKVAEEIMDTMFKKYQNIVMCSDSNVMVNEEKYFFMDDHWRDAWIDTGADPTNKYTYDGKLNGHLFKKNIKYRSRLDRVIYRTKGDIELKVFSLIKSKDSEIEPSDHFGVNCIFETR